MTIRTKDDGIFSIVVVGIEQEQRRDKKDEARELLDGVVSSHFSKTVLLHGIL